MEGDQALELMNAAIDKMKRNEIYDFIKARRYGVVSTVSQNGTPEAAFVGLAVTPGVELIFETINTTRKYENLKRDPRVAIVIGGDDGKTLQYEGIADEPDEYGRDAFKSIYYEILPENRSHDGWPGLVYIRVRPRWIRLSDYGTPWRVEEFRFDP
jgi:general stress protein 26